MVKIASMLQKSPILRDVMGIRAKGVFIMRSKLIGAWCIVLQ